MVTQYAAMIPTLAPRPFHRDGWVYEEKVDGYRMLAYKDGSKVRLVSRNGVDHTKRYSDVAVGIARLKPKSLILDGELAVTPRTDSLSTTKTSSSWPPVPIMR